MIKEKDWKKELDKFTEDYKDELILLAIILSQGDYNLTLHFDFIGIGELELNMTAKEVIHGNE